MVVMVTITGMRVNLVVFIEFYIWYSRLASRQVTTGRNRKSLELESTPACEEEKDKELESTELEPKHVFSIAEEKETGKKQESALLASNKVHRLTEEKEQAILSLESQPDCIVKEKERDKNWSINIEELITEFSNQDRIRDGTAASEVVEEVATTLVAASKQLRKTKSKGRMGKERAAKKTAIRLSKGNGVTQSVDGNVSIEASEPELNTAEERSVPFGLSKESTNAGPQRLELGTDTLEDSAQFEEDSHLLGTLPA